MHDDLRKQFAHLDRDGSGYIEPLELLAGMGGGDLSRAKQIIEMMDLDGDGRVSLEEFLGFYGELAGNPNEVLSERTEGWECKFCGTANPPATEACEACGALAVTAAGPVADKELADDAGDGVIDS